MTVSSRAAGVRGLERPMGREVEAPGAMKTPPGVRVLDGAPDDGGGVN